MLYYLKPTHIFLNFANYLNTKQLDVLLEELKYVTHIGFGPKIDNIQLNY